MSHKWAGYTDDVPTPSPRAPPLRTPTTARSGTRIGRSKTLTRPDRAVKQPPLINPDTTLAVANADRKPAWFSPWVLFSRLVTFWAPSFVLSSFNSLKDSASQQAWREKVALCFIALVLGAFVGFATMGLNVALCPETATISSQEVITMASSPGMLGVHGWSMNISAARLPNTGGPDLYQVSSNNSGQDVTTLFSLDSSLYPKCSGITAAYATVTSCPGSVNPSTGMNPSCPLGPLNAQNLNKLGMQNSSKMVGYAWNQVATAVNHLVIDGNVLNLSPYMNANPSPISGDLVDSTIRYVLSTADISGGKDATRLFYNRAETQKAVACLEQRYLAGRIDKTTPGCVVAQIFLYSSLVIILGIVLARFIMAIWFSWFQVARMARTPRVALNAVPHNVMPEGANVEINNMNGAAPWSNRKRPPQTKLRKGGGNSMLDVPSNSTLSVASGSTSSGPSGMSVEEIGAEPFTIALVTCYSEGQEGIANTLDSLAGTTYSDSRKLLFVVADGMITGSGETVSTPDICVGMLDADPRFGTPMPMSYVAVAQGKKQHNMAMVYAGHYTRAKGHRTPMIVVVKCGTPEEATGAKAGNRGKRDSQLILMHFFSRVTYNDRMTPLDFDLFRKMHALMGVTPDFFEICLMVDADTKVYPDSMTVLVNTMLHDNLIMGVCGETRIANKRDSWVTMIQVYEYFISHHLAKAFESVFGGVTCLPGCFSMYRLKARKTDDDEWVPIITKPEVVKDYSQNTVATLHQKNLLLLGEDRFLTTLLLRTFPNRKMLFCPKARCRTVVPDSFRVLLSQRRRWINSTIHNLMELVLVRDLCGTFCFSMQFVVFMDLIGTTVLPVAISLTYALAINYALHPPRDFQEAIPLLLLCSVIGLPAVLILLATRKVVYVLWMIIYLIALPVWNFVLPVYAFWHFDDFSWGETRKVEGEQKGDSHAGGDGTFVANSVPLRRWEDWERSRLRKLTREEKRRRELERAFGSRKFHGGGGDGDASFEDDNTLAPSRTDSRSDFNDEESDSLFSADDDQFGMQIGVYNEHDPHSRPPPPQVIRHSVAPGARQVDAAEMIEMLDQGWDDDDEGSRSPSNQSSPNFPTGWGPNGPPQKYQLSDGPVQQPPAVHHGGYAPLQRSSSQSSPRGSGSPAQAPRGQTSAIESGSGTGSGHARKRSGGYGYVTQGTAGRSLTSGSQSALMEGEDADYGPLGPLTPEFNVSQGHLGPPRRH